MSTTWTDSLSILLWWMFRLFPLWIYHKENGCGLSHISLWTNILRYFSWIKTPRSRISAYNLVMRTFSVSKSSSFVSFFHYISIYTLKSSHQFYKSKQILLGFCFALHRSHRWTWEQIDIVRLLSLSTHKHSFKVSLISFTFGSFKCGGPLHIFLKSFLSSL